jgi:hypothetical protein
LKALIIVVVGFAMYRPGSSNKAIVGPVTSAVPVVESAPGLQSPANTTSAATGINAPDMQLALAGKNWMRREREDKDAGHKVFFTIFTPEFDTWRSKLSRPRITVTCTKNPVSARIWPAGPLKDGNVKITFDNGTVLQQKWNLVDGAGVPSADDEAALFKGLATAKALKFENNPDDAPTKVFTFNLGDYHESVLKEPLCNH